LSNTTTHLLRTCKLFVLQVYWEHRALSFSYRIFSFLKVSPWWRDPYVKSNLMTNWQKLPHFPHFVLPNCWAPSKFDSGQLLPTWESIYIFSCGNWCGKTQISHTSNILAECVIVTHRHSSVITAASCQNCRFLVNILPRSHQMQHLLATACWNPMANVASENILSPALHLWQVTCWRSWLRYCVTSRKVAGSIPVGVVVSFFFTYFFLFWWITVPSYLWLSISYLGVLGPNGECKCLCYASLNI
jgi:hypothetical protein